MKSIFRLMYGEENLSEARGVTVGYRDEGFRPRPGENYYIFAGGTKPYHAGHDQMIMHAINDAAQDPNGRVLLFIGLGDRGVLKGANMAVVWKSIIEDYYESISPDVHIEYGGGPVGKVLSLLNYANQIAAQGDYPENRFYIYSDPEDTEQYYLLPKFSKKDPSIELKSSPPKYHQHLRSLDPPGVTFMGQAYPGRFTRGGEGGTIDISGTAMRSYLENGDIQAFMNGLPTWMSQQQKQKFFELLTIDLPPATMNEIKRAEKGTSEYSTYLDEVIDELHHLKSSYGSRTKAGSRYRKEAHQIQNAISAIRQMRRKNDKIIHSNDQALNERVVRKIVKERQNIEEESFDRDVLKDFFRKFRK